MNSKYPECGSSGCEAYKAMEKELNYWKPCGQEGIEITAELKAENQRLIKALEEVIATLGAKRLFQLTEQEAVKNIDWALITLTKALAGTETGNPVTEAQPECKPCKCEEYRQALKEIKNRTAMDICRKANIECKDCKSKCVYYVAFSALAGTQEGEGK